jgi:hypothetical protein
VLRRLSDSGDFVCAVWLNKPGARWDVLCVLCLQRVSQKRVLASYGLSYLHGHDLRGRMGELADADAKNR